MTDPVYLTPTQLREQVQAMANRTAIDDETLSDFVSEFEDVAERYCGVAFVARTATDTVAMLPEDLCDRSLALWLNLAHPRVTAVTAASIDGTDLAVGDLTIDELPGRVYSAGGWYGTVVVTYTHGIADTPKGILRACREYVRSCALRDTSSVPRDVIAESIEGQYTRYSTPDWDAGRPTGYMEVDRLLNMWRSAGDAALPAIG